jgi:hypothetical protein
MEHSLPSMEAHTIDALSVAVTAGCKVSAEYQVSMPDRLEKKIGISTLRHGSVGNGKFDV